MKQIDIKTTPRGLYGYKRYNNFVVRVCPECKKEYKHYVDEIEYKIDKLVFCSWSCKCKWRRENDRKSI